MERFPGVAHVSIGLSSPRLHHHLPIEIEYVNASGISAIPVK